MSVLTMILVGAGLVSTVGVLAGREHRSVRSSRQALLDRCANVINGVEIHHGHDGFPTLVGSHRGRRVHLELIPDTMVIRRLPQLWASLTYLATLTDVPSLAVLVRPAGNEFYSLTGSLPQVLDPPPDFPSEVLVRGSDAQAVQLLKQLRLQLATILADPRVKEIAITCKGLRIISQAGEGRRGEHLLLRQAVFDDAGVRPSEFSKRLEELDTLHKAIEADEWKQAA